MFVFNWFLATCSNYWLSEWKKRVQAHECLLKFLVRYKNSICSFWLFCTHTFFMSLGVAITRHFGVSCILCVVGGFWVPESIHLAALNRYVYFQVLRFRVRVHKDFICICLHFISVNVIVVHGLYAWVKRLRRKKNTNVASWVGHFRTQIYTVIALVNISSKVFSFGQCFFISRPIYGSHLFHYLF